MNDKDFENYLRENLRLNRENNDLLKKINARQMWSRAGSMIYAGIVLIVVLVVAYFIVKNLPQIKQDFSVISTGVSAFTGNTPAPK